MRNVTKSLANSRAPRGSAGVPLAPSGSPRHVRGNDRRRSQCAKARGNPSSGGRSGSVIASAKLRAPSGGRIPIQRRRDVVRLGVAVGNDAPVREGGGPQGKGRETRRRPWRSARPAERGFDVSPSGAVPYLTACAVARPPAARRGMGCASDRTSPPECSSLLIASPVSSAKT